MTYNVNDTILYGANICKITDITKHEGSQEKQIYYVLKPLYDSNTVIYAPVDHPNTVEKMRRILSADEIYELIRNMPDEETIWIENDNARKEQYQEILRGGDRMALIQLIKTLFHRQKAQKEAGKKLRIADERFMKEAERILYDEFAHVLNIEPEQVLPLITRQIELQERK